MPAIVAPLFQSRNSAPCCWDDEAADKWLMPARTPEPASKKSKVTPEQKAECERLLALYRDRVPGRMSQDQFGHAFDLGNQSNVGHYLHGRQSLNAVAALKFAKGLECVVEDFSPRLAREIVELVSLATPDRVRGLQAKASREAAAYWPFPQVPMAKIIGLRDSDIARIEGAIMVVVGQLDSEGLRATRRDTLPPVEAQFLRDDPTSRKPGRKK